MNRDRLRNLLREDIDLLATQRPLQDDIQAKQNQIQVRQSQFHTRESRAHRYNPGPTPNEKKLHDTIMRLLIDQNRGQLRRLHNISRRRAEIRDELRTAGVPELVDDETVWFWLCLTGWSWFGLTVRIRSFWVTDLIVRFWSWFWGDQGPFGHWIVLHICGLFRGFWDELLRYLHLIWQLGAAF
ncbi:hypothetical protein N8T08_004006 [Aspergillus melleus]|uniref:Uncharacterized protein n=1 Tax=Aspergillus melleus TaxID=138277 RepID=A0ACC3B657_9EURO|nr:hypothetical protein N8T08_004006 [Aspergillus melleus]